MKVKLGAGVVFSGEFGDPDCYYRNYSGQDIVLDPDLAAAELRQAGYEVVRLPYKYAERLWHPLDDFIEVFTEGPDDDKVIDAFWKEVEAIVAKYGGLCDECGPIERDHVPFAGLFKVCGRLN